MRVLQVLFLAGVSVLGTAHAQQSYYVATNGALPYDGAGWASAFSNVQMAIDAGTGLDWITAESTDLDGNPRLAKGIPSNAQILVDMGAYEMPSRIRGTIFVIR